MELLQLKLMVSLAETLNFTKTARKFYITQPAVSYHLRELEKELNVQLFIRDTHKTVFTSAGLEMLSYAKAICELETAATQRMKNIAEGRTGHLTIGLLADYVSELTESLIPFSREFPYLQIDTHVMEGQELIESIQNSEYDFYFAIDSMISYNKNYGLIRTSTRAMEIYLYDKVIDTVDINDWSTLSGFAFLSMTESDRPLYDRTCQIFENHHFNPRVIHHYNRIDSILVSVNSGIGFAILPAAFHDGSTYSHIATIPLSDPQAILTSSIGYKVHNYTESSCQFKGMLLERYSQ